MEFAASGFGISYSEDCTTTPSSPLGRNFLEIFGHIIAFVISLQCSDCPGQAGVLC